MNKSRPSFSEIMRESFSVKRRKENRSVVSCFLQTLAIYGLVYAFLCFDTQHVTLFSLGGNIFFFYTVLFSWIFGVFVSRYEAGIHSGSYTHVLGILLAIMCSFITYRLFVFLGF